MDEYSMIVFFFFSVVGVFFSNRGGAGSLVGRQVVNQSMKHARL